MNHDRVMLLIDADNVSLDVIEQAVPWVHKHYGGPHVRRAYCTAESAVKHQAAFKRLSIRPMVNIAAGKNSTDIALAVDAIDLVIAERPEVVVIASSDSDFAPLVSRLREKGCRVVGIGQNGKTASETQAMYDDYEVLVHHRGGNGGAAASAAPAAAPAAAKSSRRRSARAAEPAPPVESLPAVAPAAAPAGRKTTARKSARKTAVAAPAPAQAVPSGRAAGNGPRTAVAGGRRGGGQGNANGNGNGNAGSRDKLQALLQALPELMAGDELDLRTAAERLRKFKLLAKSVSSTKLFGQYPDHFELVPADKPTRVRTRRVVIA